MTVLSFLFRIWLIIETVIRLMFSQYVREPLPQNTHNLEAETARQRRQTMEQIMEWNNSLYAEARCDMINLEKIPETVSGSDVTEWITGYVYPNYPLVNGVPASRDYRIQLEAYRNTETVADSVPLRYAVVKEFTAVRSFPTADKIQDTPDGFDYFQETGFPPGECVVVCHQTADGAWSFVRGEFYAGWVQSGSLAQVEREPMISWLKRQKTAVNCLVALEFTTVDGLYCPMGTVLPLVRRDGKETVVGLPDADANGNLVWRESYLPSDNVSFRVGYLPLTEENMRRQGERCLGIAYGWGDEGGNPDCSSTVKAIYRCFGVRLPRNTSAQIAVPGSNYNLSAMPAGQRRELLQTLPFGTLLYCPGHIMLSWGADADGEPLILHNTTQYTLLPDGEAVRAYGCVLTPASIGTGAGIPYYEAISAAVIPTVIPWQ